MGTLIKFELKKLYKSRLNQIVFLGTCLLMAFIMLLSIRSTWTYNKEGNRLSGLEGIQYDKEVMKELEGPLTDERVESLIKEYQDMLANPDNLEDGFFKDSVRYRYYYPKQHLLMLIAHNYDEIFTHTFGGNLSSLDLEDRMDFYEAGRERILNTMLYSEDWKYSNEELEFWEKKEDNINTPIYYGYAGGWDRLFDVLGFFIIPFFSLGVLLARTYSGEYESGAEHIILTTKYGKTKVILAKNIAALMVGGVFSLINIAIPYVIILSAFGVEGGTLPIQNYDGQIPYPYTFVQTILLYSVICLVSAFCLTAVILFLSARMKTALPVLTATLVLILSGAFLQYNSNGVYNHIISLLPYKVIPAFDLTSLMSYPFGDFVLDYPSMIFVVYITLGIILILFAGRAFRRHEVE